MQMTLGKQIKMLRTEKGLTQAELGEILGKGGSTVRMWELDKSSPDRKALYKICEVFSVTPDYFYYNATPPEDMDSGLKRTFEEKRREGSFRYGELERIAGKYHHGKPA